MSTYYRAETSILITSVLMELKTRFGSPQRSICLAAAALVSTTFSAEASAPLVKAANEAGCAIDEEILHHEMMRYGRYQLLRQS